TVQADAVTVNTESGTTSSTVTERQIQDIPLVNRSVLDLALTQPNVSGDAGSEDPVITTITTCPGCNLSLNGGRPLNTLNLAVGGPVFIPKVYNGKNRTFWFAAIEPQYRRDQLDQYALAPTDAMRQGNFSGLVNTASGWLPQSVVDQFRPTNPSAVASVGDS